MVKQAALFDVLPYPGYLIIYLLLCQTEFFDKSFIERPGLNSLFFVNEQIKNYAICITGMGSNKEFSIILTDSVPDIQVIMNGQIFPLHYFEERSFQDPSLFDSQSDNDYIKRDGISDFILERAKKQYGKNITKEDIFYYGPYGSNCI